MVLKKKINFSKVESVPRANASIMPSGYKPKIPGLDESSNNVADHNKKNNVWVPTEQVAVVQSLQDILIELKQIKEELRKR